MTRHRQDDDFPTYASPPCFRHELDPAYPGVAAVDASGEPADVMRWRKTERERLIQERLDIPSDVRRQWDTNIASNLEEAIGDVAGLIISVYWPMRGEPDLHQFVDRVVARGGRVALPVVVERGAPLIFREWALGQRLERGVWDLRVPPEDADVVVPDAVVVPVVGFDRRCYRLGYGGGYFDRTLATMRTKPRVFGVGYQDAGIATIHPQPHDIPMSVMVTDRGLLACPPRSGKP